MWDYSAQGTYNLVLTYSLCTRAQHASTEHMAHVTLCDYSFMQTPHSPCIHESYACVYRSVSYLKKCTSVGNMRINLHAYTYICISIRVNVCVRTACIHISTYIYISIYVHALTSVYISVYIYMYVHMCGYMMCV